MSITPAELDQIINHNAGVGALSLSLPRMFPLSNRAKASNGLAMCRMVITFTNERDENGQPRHVLLSASERRARCQALSSPAS